MPTNRRILSLFGLLLLTIGIAAAWLWVASPTRASHTTTIERQVPKAVPTCGPQFLVQQSQNVGTTDNSLTGVSALSFGNAWAVGFYTDTSGLGQMLIERWNGNAWSTVPTPTVGTGDSYLQAVSARTASDVWAVGYYRPTIGAVFQTLILHYDGTQWTQVASPHPGMAENYLYGVTFVSATDAWAVGYYSNSANIYQTLTLHWNGTQWNLQQSPNPLLGVAVLRGVVALAANDVWAVGAQADILTFTIHTYALHWNGSNWSGSTPTNTTGCVLAAVGAAGAGNMWAVGGCQATTYQTLILRYNGSSWTSQPSPSPGSGDNLLGGVAVLSSTEAYAVGGYSDGTVTHSLAVAWDGTQWTQMASQDPGTTSNALLSAGLVPGFNIVLAVGYQASGGASQTLAEWKVVVVCEPTVTPTPTVATTASATPAPSGTPIDLIPYFRVEGPQGCSSPFWQRFNISTDTQPYAQVLVTTTMRFTGPDNTFMDITVPPFTGSYTYYYNCDGAIHCPGWVGQDVYTLTVDLDNVVIETNEGNNTLTQLIHSPPTVTPCPPPSRTPTFTPTITPTGTRPTATNTATPTLTPTGTRTVSATPTSGQLSTPLPTSTSCPIQFTDVQPGSTFYDFVRCLACRGIINGYSDGTFRPNNQVTRGQLSKIVSNSAGFTDPQSVQQFQDVPIGSTFFDYIGRLASRGYIGGYACGGPGEPCVGPGNLPYFRPNANATRGQISKIVSNAAGFQDPIPAGQQSFQDVPPGSTFYDFIERLASRGVMGGYQCGGPGEPCIGPGNLPYFRPNNNATRGQTSKIVANTFFPNCTTPSRR